MSQPPGFQDKIFPSYVYQLHKSLYGLKQAPREWFKRFSFLHSLNFQGSSIDSSPFFLYHNNTPIFILIYGDDILLISPSFVDITRLIQTLKNTFTMKDLGPAHYFLGIEFLRKSNGCFLFQTKYALSIIKKLHMEHTKPVSNPCSFSTSNLSKLIYVDPSIYRSTVGALQYLTITWPDISCVVNKACQSMHSPTEDDWLKVKHLLRYIKGTLTDSLFYHSQSDFTLEVFIDADWASSSSNRRSTGGFNIFLGQNLISWSSQKKKIVSWSSIEAEYRALSDATTEILRLRSLLQELRLPLPFSPILWCDNIGATYLAENPVFHSRMKHVEIHYHFVRELVNSKQLRIGYLSTKDQLANFLTKALPKQRFLHLKSKLHVLPTVSLQEGIKTLESNGNSNQLRNCSNPT